MVDIVEIVAKQGIVKDITIHEGMPYGHVMEVVAMEFSAIGFTVRRLCLMLLVIHHVLFLFIMPFKLYDFTLGSSIL